MDSEPNTTPTNKVFYISSDESIESLNSASVDDLTDLFESEDEDVALLAQCVERQMEIFSTSRKRLVPDNCDAIPEKFGTPRPSFVPGTVFDSEYCDLGMSRGPIARDCRLTNNHPINICRQSTPMVDFCLHSQRKSIRHMTSASQ